MGIFSKFEGRVEDTFEGAANKMFDSPISPVQIAKKAEKQMRREKMVGAGKQFAPTLYTVLVNGEDDARLFGYYPTLAGETETYLSSKAVDEGLVMDGQPLVRFIVDDGLKRGKFEVIAEMVSSPIIKQLRAEEMARYGIGSAPAGNAAYNNRGAQQQNANFQPLPQNRPSTPVAGNQRDPLPYVPEEEIDYSLDYGEYTFNSQNFEDPRQNQEMSNRPSVPIAGGAAVPAVQSGANVAANTTVFAAGAGNAQPTPQGSLVRARLINQIDNRAYDLASSRLLMGRDNSCDIVVDDINASRKHAEIKFEQQGVWAIADLGSTNGTTVNGRPIAAQALNNGDVITIGMTNFVFNQA